MDEVEWDQAVDLPIDGPELVVEIKYANSKLALMRQGSLLIASTCWSV
jgi:hypothetical protein